MRDEETQRQSSGFEGLFGRGKYKLWVLGAILLLAVWSMFTGTITLKWSSLNNNLKNPSLLADFDVLDVDEREKTVRQMWNVYKHSKMIRLPSFWREAFDAAYQHLTDEAAGVRNAALLEIAKMSLESTDVQDSPLLNSESVSEEARPRTLAVKARKRK